MAGWGRNIADLTGTVEVVTGSVDIVGTSTTFLAEVQSGNVLTIDGVEYVVAVVVDDEDLKLRDPYAGSSDTGLTIKVSEKPSADRTIPLAEIYGVDRTEARLIPVSAPGWVRRRTVGSRILYETLVAMKTPPVEDPADDDVIPNTTTTTTTAAPTTTTTTAAPTTTTTTAAPTTTTTTAAP
jgi:hypothetical protein